MIERETVRVQEDRALDWQEALYIPLTILAWLAIVLLGGWLLSHVVKTLLTIVLAGVIAFALTPLVSRLERRIPRPFAILTAYVFGFALVFGLLSVVVITAAGQISSLVQHLPEYAKHAQAFQPRLVRLLGPLGITQASFNAAEARAIAQAQAVGTGVAKSSLDILTQVVGTVVDVVLVLILSVYFVADGKRIGAWLRRQTPGAQRRHTTLLIAIVNQVVGGYIRGTLTMATLIGVLVGGGLLVLHVPYAVLLGVLAFFMEFIPVVGVLVSGAASILIALLNGPLSAAVVAGYFVLVHVLEGDVVGPRIMGKSVGIHPATALLALVAGTELFGIWGALFGAPLAGLIQAIATAAWKEMRGGDPTVVLNAAVTGLQEEVDKPPAPVA